MTFWDGLFVVVGGILLLEGIVKGALRLCFSVAGLWAGCLYAAWAAPRLSPLLFFLPPSLREGAALVAGFALLLGAFVVAGHLLTRLFHGAGLSLLNRLLGALAAVLLTIYLAGGAVRLSWRLSPDLGRALVRGPVVRTLSALAFGLDALVPVPVLPAGETPQPPPAPPKGAGV